MNEADQIALAAVAACDAAMETYIEGGEGSEAGLQEVCDALANIRKRLKCDELE